MQKKYLGQNITMWGVYALIGTIIGLKWDKYYTVKRAGTYRDSTHPTKWYFIELGATFHIIQKSVVKKIQKVQQWPIWKSRETQKKPRLVTGAEGD